ncbi:MFS transporter (macronuclear) [Tetrahymena thermophila SB210]|uniref:MFS transporter n=1 Tax=Tetrahymena thermophila (strain SB210) TaxID=312017 RepID=X1W3U6_TETTS|nr:MFS transporter [Tetrahymena thermophila SB210]EAR97974.3 MFS transporter [Tetrahymena thermophila SB210]|eukprot:XP_001018219.3 MFS transporter [Tetrahymena thermophila SB210]
MTLAKNKLDQNLLEERIRKSIQQKSRVKKQIHFNLFTLITISFLQSASVSIIVPFFPPLATKEGAPLICKGLVLGINPIGSFLYSFISGKMLNLLGQKNVFCLGIIIQSISISTFGALYNLNDDAIFICICFFSRLIQGFSRAAISSSFVTYIPQIWPEEFQIKASLIERVGALGTLLGPGIGQVFYTFLGHQMPFYILSFIFLCSLLTLKWLPSNIKINNSVDTSQYYRYLSDKTILATFLVIVGISTAQSFIIPLYAVHIEGLGLTDDLMGYFFSVSSFFYIVFLFLMPRIQKYINRKLFLTFGILIAAIGIEFQAPENLIESLFGINLKKWYLVTIGQCIINIASSMCILPMVPELNQLIIDKETKERQVSVLDTNLIKTFSGMASRIFILGSSLGLFIGPFSAGILYSSFGGQDINEYKNTSRCIAGFQFVIFVIYLILGESYKGFIQQKKLIKTFIRKSQKFNENLLNSKHKSTLKSQNKDSKKQSGKNSVQVMGEQSNLNNNNQEYQSVVIQEHNQNASQFLYQNPNDVSDILLSDNEDESDFLSFGQELSDECTNNEYTENQAEKLDEN